MKKDKIPDRRAMEKMTSDLSRLLERQNFESEEQVNDFMNKIVKKGKPSKVPPKSAVELAQDIMYEAWDEDSTKERIELAKEALSISLDCADAYNLLAEEAETLAEEKELYKKGIEAGERALGKKFFKLNKGSFWGCTSTRPYMRSLAGYMECLWDCGQHKEAIEYAQKMLELNSNDNQGIRYQLVSFLAESGKYGELDDLLNKSSFKNDCSAEWLYFSALLAFIQDGDSTYAKNKLKIALEMNKYVALYLTEKKPLPRYLPDRISRGGEDEGFYCAAISMPAWKRVPGAIEWLKDQSGIKIFHNVGRNDLCPCGSGKKYKKCCGM